jgi:hypothetical protein
VAQYRFDRSRQERECLRGFIELKASNISFILLFLLVFKWLGQVFIIFRGPRLLNLLFLFYRLVILNKVKNNYNEVISKLKKVNKTSDKYYDVYFIVSSCIQVLTIFFLIILG